MKSSTRKEQVVNTLLLGFGNRPHKAGGNLMKDFFKVLTEESITGNYGATGIRHILGNDSP